MSGTFPTVINGVRIDMPVMGVVNADGSALTGGGGSIASEQTLIEIRDAVLQQRGFSVSIVKDSTDAYFMQAWTWDQATQTPNVVVYNLDGTLATTQVPPFSVASKSITVSTEMYAATATKIEYTTGDKLSFTIVYDDGDRAGIIWHNETLNTAISPPVAGDYEAESETINLPANASTLTEQEAQTTLLESLDSKLPALVSSQVPVVGPLSDAELRADPVEVVSSNPNSINSGQVKIATTGTAVSLGAATFVNGVVIKAAPSNAGNIFIGPSGVTTVTDGTGNGYILEAGDAIAYGASTLSSVFINGTAGDFVYLTGN